MASASFYLAASTTLGGGAAALEGNWMHGYRTVSWCQTDHCRLEIHVQGGYRVALGSTPKEKGAGLSRGRS